MGGGVGGGNTSTRFEKLCERIMCMIRQAIWDPHEIKHVIVIIIIITIRKSRSSSSCGRIINMIIMYYVVIVLVMASSSDTRLFVSMTD